MNYFGATKENPYHISIGGLVINEEGKILVHHFRADKLPEKLRRLVTGDLYILMRETIEPNETIEQTLARGLMEEFGAKGELVKYLGSLKGKFPVGDKIAEKTTLYFLVKYLQHDESKRQEGSLESESILEWIEPKDLILLMDKQQSRDSSLNESEIIQRFIDLGDSTSL